MIIKLVPVEFYSNKIHSNVISSLTRHVFLFFFIFSLLSACSKDNSRTDIISPENPRLHNNISERPCVIILNNRLYGPRVLSLIEETKKQIDLVIYQTRYYPAFSDSSSNQLFLALAGAQKRGVSIRFLFETSDWNPDNSFQNRRVAFILKELGVDVRFDSPFQNSHNKLVIIDNDIVVIGSANWSHYSLERNNEASIGIRSTQIATEFKAYFEKLFQTASTEYPIPFPLLSPELARTTSSNLFRVRGTIKSINPIPHHQDEFEINLDHKINVIIPEQVSEELFSLFPGFPNSFLHKEVTLFVQVTKIKNDGRENRVLSFLELEKGIQQDFFKRVTKRAIDQFNLSKDLWQSCHHIQSHLLLNNDDYFTNVIDAIEKATRKIRVMQLDCNYYQYTEKSGELPATNKLLDALIAAKKRGVAVEFLAEYRSHERFSDTKKMFLDKLVMGGVPVYLDDGDNTTHCKMLIIDDRFVIIGSTNWSLSALRENNESSILIESTHLARSYNHFFDHEKVTPYKE